MEKYKRMTNKKIDIDNLSDKAKSRISDTYLEYAKMNNALWELENKIENGTLVELPCKVGDKVYVPWVWDGDCAIATVDIEEIKFYDTQMHYMFFIDMMSDDESFNQEFGGWKTEQSIGETIFLTQAEAEKKLKELKGEV